MENKSIEELEAVDTEVIVQDMGLGHLTPEDD